MCKAAMHKVATASFRLAFHKAGPGRGRCEVCTVNAQAMKFALLRNLLGSKWLQKTSFSQVPCGAPTAVLVKFKLSSDKIALGREPHGNPKGKLICIGENGKGKSFKLVEDKVLVIAAWVLIPL